MTTYTKPCSTCGQNWEGWGTSCNDCQRMKLLKETNELQAENMREQQRDRDRADQRRRDDDREMRAEAEEIASNERHRREWAWLRAKELTNPGWGRANDTRKKLDSANQAKIKADNDEWRTSTIKAMQTNNNIAWLLGSIVGAIILFVYFGPWTTDWIALKLIGLASLWVWWAILDESIVRDLQHKYKPGIGYSSDGLPTVQEIYTKMLIDDATSEAQRIADENLLPPMPGTNIPAKARKEPLFK